MKSMLLLVLFCLPFAKGLAFQRSAASRVAEVSHAKCVADPDSCANGVDQMIETVATIKQEVRGELNATRTRLHSIYLEFDRCNDLTSEVSSKRSDFNAKAETHKTCRVQQKADFDASMTCKKLLSALKEERTLLCEKRSLTESPNDLVPLCTPSHEEGIGMWLEDMAETFSTRSTQWKKDHDACQTAGTKIAPQEASCSLQEHALHQREEKCGDLLAGVESFSCDWAKDFKSQCSAYDTCFASVLSRHSDAVREANESVVRWRKSWLAAERMECMANSMRAMNTSDSGNRTQLHACNNENITNTSFIKIVIPEVPSKAECPTPEIYPGSNLYKAAVYDNLPEGVTVRQPTPCHWSRQSMVFANTAGNGVVSGDTWTQGGTSSWAWKGHGWTWTGARGEFAMCASGDEKVYEFSVSIERGAYHMVGVAPEACCAGVNTYLSSGDFAALYSHTTGWNRHRGSALPVGTPSYEKWWKGTWDGAPQTMLVTVKCREKSFVVGIEGGDDFLGEMSWPAAWDRVYPFVGGQSNDHVYKLRTIQGSEPGVGDTPCTFYTYSVESYTGSLDKIAAPVEGASTQQRSPTKGDISSLRLSGAPGCTATFYCYQNCMSNTGFGGGFQVQPYKFIFTVGPDRQDVKKVLKTDLQVTTLGFKPQVLQDVVNARVSVSVTPPREELVLKGAGCCRFKNWKAKHLGSRSADECVSLCLANVDCKAADITADSTGVSSRPHKCWHFFGDPFQNFVLQCDTTSQTKFCYRREEV